MINLSRQILTNQRGAMFGMDARVALIIFAAMASVGGYYGYGKVTLTKQGALLKELQNMEDAIFQLQVDLGGLRIKDAVNLGSDGIKDVNALWDKTNLTAGFQKYWAGPYYKPTTRQHLNYGVFTFSYLQANRTACSTSANCYTWIELTNVPAAIWTRINKYIDENEGTTLEASGQEHTLGRIQADAATDPRTIYYRATKRPL